MNFKEMTKEELYALRNGVNDEIRIREELDPKIAIKKGEFFISKNRNTIYKAKEDAKPDWHGGCYLDAYVLTYSMNTTKPNTCSCGVSLSKDDDIIRNATINDMAKHTMEYAKKCFENFMKEVED